MLDQLDRVIEETDPVGQSRHSRLYQDGQLWTAFDRNGKQIAYSYDNLGRLTGEEWLMEGERWFEYFHDELDRLDSVADSH